MDKLKAGDIVKLKTGGPAMIVAGPTSHAHILFCYWFAGEELKKGEIPEITLVKVESQNNP